MDTRALEALSDSNRLAIIDLLASQGERCVCDVSATLQISNALASHHIKKLRAAGLVATERRGAWLHCSLRREALLEIASGLRELAERDAGAGRHGVAACCATGKEASDE